MPKIYEEQCELFIEQEIEQGLEAGKTPYSIAKEISAWVEKLFGRTIKPDTVRKRAERKNVDNVHTASTTSFNNEINTNKEITIVTCGVCGKLYDEKIWDKTLNGGRCPYCFRGFHADGGLRERAIGGGRPPKFAVIPDNTQFRTSGTGENEWYTP